MRVRVGHGADAVYLNLTDRPVLESEEVADGIVLPSVQCSGVSSKLAAAFNNRQRITYRF